MVCPNKILVVVLLSIKTALKPTMMMAVIWRWKEAPMHESTFTLNDSVLFGNDTRKNSDAYPEDPLKPL